MLGKQIVCVGAPSGTKRRSDCLGVVLGWYGSTQRRLRRHGQLLAAATHADTLVVAPCMAAASHPPVGSLVARSVAQAIVQHQQQTNQKQPQKLVFLLLSGHGENIFQHFVLEQNKRVDLCCVRGVVHDSAPVEPSAALWAQAATAAACGLLPRPLRPHTPVYHLPLVTPLCRVMSAAHMALPWNSRWVRRCGHAVDRLYGRCCQHKRAGVCALPREVFLYSNCDPVVSTQRVAAAAEALRKRHRDNGCRHPEQCVRECFFVGSGHVDHLRSHPAQYERAVSRLVHEALD